MGERVDSLCDAIRLSGPRPFRDLVGRWRIGNLRVGAAAAEVLDATSQVPAPPVTPLKLSEAVLVTTGFCGLTLIAAIVLLNRRDL